MRTNDRELLIEKYIPPTEISKDGDFKYWYNNHREAHSFNGQPAETWCINGKITHEYWYENGEIHRDKKPAYINYDEEDGRIMYKAWYKYGELIRAKFYPNL